MKIKVRIRFWIWLIGVVLITLFILCNSFQNIEVSKQLSGDVTDIVIPNTEISSERMEFFVRKSAHLFEFALLGAAVLCLAKEVFNTHGVNTLGFAHFYVLAVAVVDEHIQSFSDRTSSTHDILLDFAGALIGFSVVWLVMKVYNVIKRKNK